MTEPGAAETRSPEELAGRPAPAPPRSRSRWAAPAAALVLGLVLGGGAGAGAVAALSDPTRSTEYQALQKQLQSARGRSPTQSAGSTAPSASATTATATPGAPTWGEVGQTVSQGGVTVTVTAAHLADSVELNGAPHLPDAGGKFVVVQTHIVNNAQESMDLTCSLPVATLVEDDRSRRFDPIDDLSGLPGNPACNHQLQPGFSTEMTWVYMVPADATVYAWGFSDATGPVRPLTYKGVRLHL